MAHVYDTGLSVPQRTAIRDAVIAALAPLAKAATPPRYLRAIVTIARPYRGEGDEAGKDLIVAELLGCAPALAIAIGRGTYDDAGVGATELSGELELAVFAISQHERSVTEGRLYGDAIASGDATADPGIWTMLEHARERVAGADLQIAGVAAPRLFEEDEVLTAANATVWQQRYRIAISADVNPARDTTQQLLDLEGHHVIEAADPAGPPTLNPLVTVTELQPEEP